MRKSAILFEETTLASKPGVFLTESKIINGKEGLCIKNDKTKLYYDVTTGLKIADSKTMEQTGQSVTMTTNSYGDYRAVKA
jgi:hypothetical protein